VGFINTTIAGEIHITIVGGNRLIVLIPVYF
jgi:hypothetical protein